MLSLIIKHEAALQIKNIHNLIQSVIFFIITTSIFALTIGVENNQTSIAVLWICLIFSILLAGNNCFDKDFDDGTFEQLFLSGYIFELIIFSKILSQWLTNSLPLIIVLPAVALILKIDGALIFKLTIISVIATFLINFMVSLGAALTISASKSVSLLTILILPLLVPIIIFANSALGGDFEFSVKFLLALLVFLTPILTFAISIAVKVNVVD